MHTQLSFPRGFWGTASYVPSGQGCPPESDSGRQQQTSWTPGQGRRGHCRGAGQPWLSWLCGWWGVRKNLVYLGVCINSMEWLTSLWCCLCYEGLFLFFSCICERILTMWTDSLLCNAVCYHENLPWLFLSYIWELQYFNYVYRFTTLWHCLSILQALFLFFFSPSFHSCP